MEGVGGQVKEVKRIQNTESNKNKPRMWETQGQAEYLRRDSRTLKFKMWKDQGGNAGADISIVDAIKIIVSTYSAKKMMHIFFLTFPCLHLDTRLLLRRINLCISCEHNLTYSWPVASWLNSADLWVDRRLKTVALLCQRALFSTWFSLFSDFFIE